MKLWGKNSALGGVDFNAAEWVYTPIIQSGGEYDLKVSAQPNDKNLKPGVILSSLGVRYKSYCASMGRTFLISPSKVSRLRRRNLTVRNRNPTMPFFWRPEQKL